jgi:hypothetical protein
MLRYDCVPRVNLECGGDCGGDSKQKSERMSLRGSRPNLTSADGPKIDQHTITTAADVSSEALALSRGEFVGDDDLPGFLPQTTSDGHKLLQGELAFIYGNENGVRTALNGLDKRYKMLFPGDPEVARIILQEHIRLVGFVWETPNMSGTNGGMVQVTLVTGGTYAVCAPPAYNYGTKEEKALRTSRTIIQGSAVCAAVPSLIEPKQGSMPGKVPVPGKVGLVLEARDKRSDVQRIMALHSAARDNAANFSLANEGFERTQAIWVYVTAAITRSYDTALVLGIETLIRQGFLEVGGNLPAGGIPPAGQPNHSFAVAVRLAEMFGIVRQGAAMIGADAATTKKVKEAVHETRRRMVPLPNNFSGAYAHTSQFGSRTGVTGSYARENETGVIKSDGAGQLLEAANSHFPQLVGAISSVIRQDANMQIGVATSAPNQRGNNIFQIIVSAAGYTDQN